MGYTDDRAERPVQQALRLSRAKQASPPQRATVRQGNLCSHVRVSRKFNWVNTYDRPPRRQQVQPRLRECVQHEPSQPGSRQRQPGAGDLLIRASAGATTPTLADPVASADPDHCALTMAWSTNTRYARSCTVKPPGCTVCGSLLMKDRTK